MGEAAVQDEDVAFLRRDLSELPAPFYVGTNGLVPGERRIEALGVLGEVFINT